VRGVAAEPLGLAGSTSLSPRIVNGALTNLFPTVGALLIFEDERHTSLDALCSGTLIGCRTFLTAAHCVCPDDAITADECQRDGLLDPGTLQVFLQNAGLFSVVSITIDPGFDFAVAGDVAVITLGEVVTGIAPSSLNTILKPGPGALGTIVGFGRTTAQSAVDDAGMKRSGPIITATCPGDLPNETLLCWNFTGSGASTCEGDSGGPLFIDLGQGPVVAGLSSGGDNGSCGAPDTPFETDLYVHRSWIISQSGEDLQNGACGQFGAVGTSTTAVLGTTGTITTADPKRRWTFEVPAGTHLLRVALNSQVYSGRAADLVTNDFDLFVRSETPPTEDQADCDDLNSTGFGFCEIPSPAAGAWHVLVHGVEGEGSFQLTATMLGPSSTCSADCDGNRKLSVAELVTTIDMALDAVDHRVCLNSDMNRDGAVTIDELVAGVSDATIACPPSPPTIRSPLNSGAQE